MWLMLVEALFGLGLLMFIVWWTMATPRESGRGGHSEEELEAAAAALPEPDAQRDRPGRGDA